VLAEHDDRARIAHADHHQPKIAQLTPAGLDRYANQLTRCLKALDTRAPIRTPVQHELAEVRAKDARSRTSPPASQRQYDAVGLIVSELDRTRRELAAKDAGTLLRDSRHDHLPPDLSSSTTSPSASLKLYGRGGSWLTLLREDSSLVGPRKEVRACAERQAHPGADEVVHDCLDRGAIERAGPEAPDQQPE